MMKVKSSSYRRKTIKRIIKILGKGMLVKMRDLVVFIAILLIVFVPGYFSEKYLVDTGNELVQRLNVIKNEIEEDRMENLEEVKAIKKRWDEVETVWNFFSNHQNTDDIELAFTRLIISYGEEEKAECLVNLAEVVCLIEDTPRSEKIAWVNIF